MHTVQSHFFGQTNISRNAVVSCQKAYLLLVCLNLALELQFISERERERDIEERRRELWLVSRRWATLRWTWAYLSMQDVNFAVNVGKEIDLRLLSDSFFSHFIDHGQLDHVVVVDVHAFGWLLLVLSRAIVVALVIVQFVWLGAWTLTCGNVVWTLCGSQDASASVQWEDGRQKWRKRQRASNYDKHTPNERIQLPQPQNQTNIFLPPMMKAAWAEAADRRRFQFVAHNRAVLAFEWWEFRDSVGRGRRWRVSSVLVLIAQLFDILVKVKMLRKFNESQKLRQKSRKKVKWRCQKSKVLFFWKKPKINRKRQKVLKKHLSFGGVRGHWRGNVVMIDRGIASIGRATCSSNASDRPLL